MRGVFAPSTYKESLERCTHDRSLSLTITGIAKVALYYVALIPERLLDLVMGKEQSSLSKLIANQTVYQLTSVKNTIVRKLPEFLQKNWKPVAINTVILLGAALIVYLRAPITEKKTKISSDVQKKSVFFVKFFPFCLEVLLK